MSMEITGLTNEPLEESYNASAESENNAGGCENTSIFNSEELQAEQNAPIQPAETMPQEIEAAQSVYDEYLNNEYSNVSAFMENTTDDGTTYRMIDIDNNAKISTGTGKNYDAYCGWEYQEAWNGNQLYKVYDDLDNDGQYQVTYYDSNGNISFTGVDTDLDGKVDTNITVNNNCDGIIDTAYQGNTGDCWLLTAANSFSYTSEGAEIIKNAIEVQDDGSTIVHTYVGDYTISLEELAEGKISLTNSSSTYSYGDDDMLVLELVTEKIMTDYKDGKVDFPAYIDALQKGAEIAHSLTEKEETVIEGNLADVFNYIMTGNLSSMDILTLGKNNTLNDFANGTSMTATINFLNDTVLEGPNGSVNISRIHAYAVKETDGTTVLLVDPRNPGKEILVYKSELLKFGNAITSMKFS